MIKIGPVTFCIKQGLPYYRTPPNRFLPKLYKLYNSSFPTKYIIATRPLLCFQFVLTYWCSVQTKTMLRS